MATNNLTDNAVRAAKPKEKQYKLTDGDGMYLLVKANGSKLWQFGYRFLNSQKLISFGAYPDVSLKLARDMRLAARTLLAQGINPSQKRKQDKLEAIRSQADTFQAVAVEYMDLKSNLWKLKTVVNKNQLLETYILPKIGSAKITILTTPDILSVLRMIEKQGKYEQAKRSRQLCSCIFEHARACGLILFNPVIGLDKAMTPAVSKNYTAARLQDMPAIMAALDNYTNVTGIGRAFAKLVILSACRVGAMASLRWGYFDWDNATITVPISKMKGKKSEEQNRPDHVIPISKQAMTLWRELHVWTGHTDFCFYSSGKSKHITAQTAGRIINRAGFEVTAHGFRSTMSTAAYESGLFNSSAIEIQLSHINKDRVEAAYNKAIYLDERKRIMQWWADSILPVAR